MFEPIRDFVEHTGARLAGARFFYPLINFRARSGIVLLLIFAVPLGRCVPSAESSGSDASEQTIENHSLKGQWEFRILDSGSAADASGAAGGDAPTWRSLEVPFDLGQTPEFVDFAGCLQLRRDVPEQIVRYSRRRAVALDSGHTSDVARFYLNNVDAGLIGGYGSEPALGGAVYATGHDGRLVKTLPAAGFRTDGENFIFAEICTRPGKPLFWRGAKIQLGPADRLFEDFSEEIAIAFILAALYLSISLYHLLLAVRRPKEIFNLYFGIFAMAFASFHLANTSGAELIYGSAKELQSKVDQVSLMIFTASLLLFLSRFFLNRYSRLALGLSSLYLIFAVLDIFVSHATRLMFLEFLIYTMVLALPYILFLTGREAWKGNRDARYLLVGVALIVLGAIHDILVERRILQSILLMPFAFLAFIMGIALILANRFVRVHSEVEELAAELEDKVRVRTEDLQATLSEVRALKDKQDGDYFLTAQLLQPLAGNHIRKAGGVPLPVDADFLSRQKKTFRFRHWESEIGGDLCAIHSIRLRERDVLIFFNGDAMGKSMQGAGGALIMGTVFKTIITRTQQSAKMRELYPEQWLRQCYQELRSVLLAFDGRMLISMVVGIVDEETGMLYFVNAEHPHVVLLRDGRAEFIRERGILRKLGVDDPGEVFVVQTVPLQPNDVILVGSDGRDDVQIGTNDDGLAIVNEDERAFLGDVERSSGRLDRLEEFIRDRGAVLDDLSLIRIAYREDASALDTPPAPDRREVIKEARAAYQAKNFEEVRRLLEPMAGDLDSATGAGAPAPAYLARLREFYRMLLRACIETEDFARAAPIAETYTQRFPEDNEVLLWHSLVLRRINEPQRAIDVGERLLMRDPENARNLKHLARLHLRHGSRERGAQLESQLDALAGAN